MLMYGMSGDQVGGKGLLALVRIRSCDRKSKLAVITGGVEGLTYLSGEKRYARIRHARIE